MNSEEPEQTSRWVGGKQGGGGTSVQTYRKERERAQEKDTERERERVFVRCGVAVRRSALWERALRCSVVLPW